MDETDLLNKCPNECFEHLLEQVKLNCSDSHSSATASVLRKNVDELMNEMRTNEYFGALRSVLDDEKQKHGEICKQLATAMELLIVQSHGAKNKLRGDNVEDSVKLIPSVEQKMAECRDYCLSEELTDEIEDKQLKLRMREVIENSINIENDIANNTINCIQIGRQLLLHHSEIRPITSTDLNFFESSIRISTHIWDAEVRDAVCSQLLLLKALGIGKRKKRQNFSDKITNILNNYFINHLSKPYPDEQTKLALAEQCGITLAQVSNWFGNKRIRYRKAQNKATKAAR
uniref:Homeobox domain-containing protein n=1 Tax=Meloidogyne enterolobii TaxID=390850 RepID=A0A6V7W0T9_MELEN|nr:unnamed protein product [Meloidogyne enterolobii]